MPRGGEMEIGLCGWVVIGVRPFAKDVRYVDTVDGSGYINCTEEEIKDFVQASLATDFSHYRLLVIPIYNQDQSEVQRIKEKIWLKISEAGLYLDEAEFDLVWSNLDACIEARNLRGGYLQ
jgi:hypothetical protein